MKNHNHPCYFISTNLLAGHSWKFILAQAVAAILLGIFFLLHYASALAAFAILLGLMLIASGIQGLVVMARNRKFKLWYLIYSLFWLGAGLIMLFEPFLTVIWLMIFLGVWFMLHGIELILAAALDHGHDRGFRFLVAVNGILTLTFGIVIVRLPVGWAGVFNFIFALFLVLYGIITAVVALRFRHILNRCLAIVEENN